VTDPDCIGVAVENRRHYNVLRMRTQMLGAFVMACRMLRVPCVSVNVSELKKAATGKGNADKAQMIQAARERFGHKLDEHQADAAHYGWYAGVIRYRPVDGHCLECPSSRRCAGIERVVEISLT
jgi:hypothetical protein